MNKMTMVLISCLLAVGVQARTWTKTDGSTLEGDLFSIQEKSVRIKVVKQDPVEVIKIKQLSAEDQAYIAKQKKERAEKKESRADVPKDRTAKWVTDVETAKAEAKEYQLPILLLYTAPAWCGYCRDLDEQLITQDEFQAYANQNLVLFLVDLSDRDAGKEWEANNTALVEACPIKGFPHTYLLSPDAKNLGSVQYYEPTWSIQDYIDKIEFLRMK
ncbi:thioredoxin family protein [Pontiellaceae bacterium B1224]|nr:thioredoxin family protein [Pontiellaceae bacterium B1224]